MSEKLIFFTGVYDTLDLFSHELIRAFTDMGYDTLEIDTNQMEEGLSKLAKFVQTPVKAAITFNNLAFNLELVPGKNIWEELDIPCINILLDHPLFYPDALKNAPKNAVVLCIDKKHMDYIIRFFPNISTVGFLPHGGVYLDKKPVPVWEREIDVMYAGGLSRKFVQNVIPDFSKFPFDARAVADAALQNLIDDTSVTTELALENALIKQGIELSDEEMLNVISKLHYIEMLAVSYFREKLIRMMLDAGIKVHLYGLGWDICDFISHPNLVWKGKITPRAVLDKMQDSKIVLNTMTWFKDGSHERVFNGMLAGALVVTDESLYINQEFMSYPQSDIQSAQLVMFRLNEMGNLAGIVKNLLFCPDDLQQIADNGRKCAKKAHTWKSRAKELHDDLLNYI